MAGSGGTPRQQVYTDLVTGLLDNRPDPASERFDTELEHAVAQGTLTAESAHRLRFWQRASVRALADHVRTAVPTVLGALDALAEADRATVAEMNRTLGPDPQVAAPPASGDEQPPRAEETDHGGEEPAPAQVAAPHDTPDPGSRTTRPAASTLEPGTRLILADLVATAPDRPENR